MLLKYKISAESSNRNKSTIVLAADIGATKTNMGLFEVNGRNVTSQKETSYRSKDYNSIIDMVDVFLKGISTPQFVCFGVAGPVLDGHARLSNIQWEIDRDDISHHLKINNVYLINDLEATAYGLATLAENDVAVINKVDSPLPGNVAVIAPGTGLGEAGIYWDGEYHHPFATEGGHCDFAPRTDMDCALYTYLQKQFSHVSWERLICGPGIVNIYQFLRDEMKREEPDWLIQKFKEADTAAVISQNIKESEICKETMALFITYLAHESANLVLKLKATGGLFIGGGIAPKIAGLLMNNGFNSSFCQSGRLNYLLEKVPVKLILNTKTALLGAAWFGANT